MIDELHAIIKELSDIEALLIDTARAYKTLARDAALARYDYDQAWADAQLEIKHQSDVSGQKVTVGIGDALATVAVKEQMKDARGKESDLDGAKKDLIAIEAILSSAQTRSRLLTIEANLTPRP